MLVAVIEVVASLCGWYGVEIGPDNGCLAVRDRFRERAVVLCRHSQVRKNNGRLYANREFGLSYYGPYGYTRLDCQSWRVSIDFGCRVRFEFPSPNGPAGDGEKWIKLPVWPPGFNPN